MNFNRKTIKKDSKLRDEIWFWKEIPEAYFKACSKMRRTVDETRMVEFINEFKPKNKKIIVDLGIGPGRELHWLTKLKNISKIIGIDYSQPMLNFCQKQAQKSQIKTTLLKDDLLTLNKFKPPKVEIIIYLYLFNSLGDFEPKERKIILQNIKRKMKNGDVFIVTLSKRPEEVEPGVLEELSYRAKSSKENKRLDVVMEYGALPFLWNISLKKYKRLPQLWYDNKKNDFVLYMGKNILFFSHRWSKKEIIGLFIKSGLKIIDIIGGKTSYVVISKI